MKFYKILPPPQHPAIPVQLVGHGRPVDLHRRSEHHQLIPLRDLQKNKKIHERIFAKFSDF
jgi:hypothetical protein